MIYLDSAATTLRKPPGVARAMSRAVQVLASPGRGGYPAAEEAARTAFACREEAAALFELDDPEQVVFTCNATHALNIAIRSLVRPGDSVVISGYEHNAVVRPLHAIGGVQVNTADAPLFCPEEMTARFECLLTPGVSAAICTHVSNAFGYILPVEAIAELCAKRGIPLIIDASQSAGCLPVRPRAWGAAFVAMPGHKGLYGPQGTGLLLCGVPGQPLLQGGTGSMSRTREMPDFLPDRLEAGTHNMPGIAGLLEGIRFVRRHGTDRIEKHERSLIRALAAGLARIPGVAVYSGAYQVGALSFVLQGKDCETVGHCLAARGIAVRSGLHCAPLAHETAGTIECGTVRASVSAFSTQAEIDRLTAAVAEIAD